MKIYVSYELPGIRINADLDNIEELRQFEAHYGLELVKSDTVADESFTYEAEEAAARKSEPKPEPTPEPEPELEPATVEQAAEAVKAYAAKHSIEKAREILATFGIKRTNEIKADQAAAIVKAFA